MNPPLNTTLDNPTSSAPFSILLPQVLALVSHQLRAFFPPLDSSPLASAPQSQSSGEHIEASDISNALMRFAHCIGNIGGKYYENSLSMQDFYHTDKYAVFLYYLSNCLYHAGKTECATRVYYLNKILHSTDMYFELELPPVFMLTHPLGSVFGRAKYSNFLSVYQNCTIGGIERNGKSIYPRFGKGVAMFAGSKVIGDCNIGSNVIIGANAFIINTDVPSNSLVVGIYPHHRILPSAHNVLQDIFGISQENPTLNPKEQK